MFLFALARTGAVWQSAGLLLLICFREQVNLRKFANRSLCCEDKCFFGNRQKAIAQCEFRACALTENPTLELVGMAQLAKRSGILRSLDLTASAKEEPVDKSVMRRKKVIAKLDEQLHIAEAALYGEEYAKKKTVKKTDEEGNQITVTVPKRVNKWCYTSNGNDWYLEVKYGNGTLELAKGKSAIAVGKLDNTTVVIEQVKQAVAAGELDAAIAVVAEKKAT